MPEKEASGTGHWASGESPGIREFWALVAGTFRVYGYKRQGFYARKLIGDACGVIQLQRSVDSTQAVTKFTFNLGVAYGSLLDPPVLPGAIAKATFREIHASARIGDLVPLPQDKWYYLMRSKPADPLLEEVREDLMHYGLPFVEHYLVLEHSVREWQAGRSRGLGEPRRLRLLHRLGFLP